MAFLPQRIYSDIEQGRGSSKKKKCCKTCASISLTAIFVLGTFFGFSLIFIRDGFVGIKPSDKVCQTNNSCVVNYAKPGIHLVWPWNRGEFRVVDTNDGNVTIGSIFASNFTLTNCYAPYSVIDLNAFLQALIEFEETAIFQNVLIEELKRKSLKKKDVSHQSLRFAAYGLYFTDLFCKV